MRRRGLPLTALLLSAAPALAQEAQEGRELSTDRPDKTESPYTVERGRVQVELDAATWTRDREGALLTEGWLVAPFNLKLGIGRDTDAQLVVEPYLRRTVTDRADGTRVAADGFGDVTLRLKHNLWGNDGGTTALAVMPFVKLPTATGDLGNGKAEFGVIVPLAITLSDAVGLGLMTELDLLADEEDGGYAPSFVNSASLAFTLTERLGLYTELFTERGADWAVTGDAGLTYALGEDTQLDAGANVGLTAAADDLMLFVGLSRRF